MISEYLLNDSKLIIQSDLAAQKPVYLYWKPGLSHLLYSTSIKSLLNDARVQKPLSISEEAISFLLQSGAVPPPKTIYRHIYIVGMGDIASIYTSRNEINVSFSKNFPFMNAYRKDYLEEEPNHDYILEVLFNAIKKDVETNKSSFLFHSAGKDSNMLALSLAEGGWQNKVTFVTHKSKGNSDESEISKKIAHKLGFNHKVLKEINKIENLHINSIENYFAKSPFPCVDNVTLAYPLYIYQAPELQACNIIFGDGNDSYMGTPPSKLQNSIVPISKRTPKTHLLRSKINSESRFFPFTRTPAEWFSMSGFSFKDSQYLYPQSTSVLKHWQQESELRKDWDLFDFKTDIYSSVIINEMMIRKLRNFTDVNKSNMILPFADENISEYFALMPETLLFDRKSLRNKLILRKILKERMNLDSDNIGKKGWSYDYSSIVINNLDLITNEIENCQFWSALGTNKVLTRLKKKLYGTDWSAETSRRLIYRLYLLSLWLNKNKFTN